MQKLQEQQEQQKQPLSTRYTLIPIIDPQHQKRLHQYMFQPESPKTSFCRFYLRGICIMKPNLCKFAHCFQDLILEQDQEQLLRDCNYTEKQRKKKYFQQKQDFQQKALFLLKNLGYTGLYQYQFSEKWKNSQKSKHLHQMNQINTDRFVRMKIRQVLHRENWGKLINFLVKKYPNVDYTMSFLSKWFSKTGFQKPQTRCKFSDFIKYITNVMNFKQVNVVMPPRMQKCVFLINCSGPPTTYIQQNIIQIQKQHLKAKQLYKAEYLKRLQPLAGQLKKKFMCRYYMAGNCDLSQQQCNYAHSIEQLRFQIGQTFQPLHKQIVKGRDERLNYLSLHHYVTQKIDPNVNLDQLNSTAPLRAEYRKIMHRQLYSNFMDLIRQLTGQERLLFSLIQKSYNGAGFNHSQENKFNQFQSSLWDNRYITQQIKQQAKMHKTKYVFKIPPLQQLDIYFSKLINEILIQEVQTLNIKQIIQQKQKQHKQSNKLQDYQQKQLQKQGQTQVSQAQEQSLKLILQSSFRKKLYFHQQPFSTPLHTYLKLRNKSLQETIKELTQNKNLLKHIFFETNQQNYKKLVEMCKNYFKGRKQYVHKLENIQLYIKHLHKDQINLNGFTNFRNLLQCAVLDAGKKIYQLTFGNNSLVVDKGNLCLHQKTFVKGQYQLKNHQNKEQAIVKQLKDNKFNSQRIIIVDSQQTYNYAVDFLTHCNKFGVDLQGRLKKDGYIDLIQISANFNQQKQIFVFDVFVLFRNQDKSLYQKIRNFLKLIFEDQSRVKILHDCKQDSTALKCLMDIQLKNVFDTSGMSIIIDQKQIYQSWNKKEQTNHYLLKKLLQVKTPGLNLVLDKWGAPNGVNIFKDSMKKLFHTQGSRAYFQQRPIDPEFLQYSAQDVEDLIEIYDTMKLQDIDKISQIVGQIYSNYFE